MSETPNPPTSAAPAAAPAAAAPSAATPAASRPAAASAAAKPAARPAAKAEPPRPAVVWSGIATVPEVVAPFSYTVQPGDSFESLAKDFFGDRRKADRIRAANPGLAPDAPLVPGSVVKIPKG